MGSIEQLRCGLVVALTNLTPPPNEIITRWRQTAIFAASFIFMVWLLIWSGLPIYLAPFVAWAMLVFSLTAASIWADHAHRENITVWRAWRGLGGAVCFAQWIPADSVTNSTPGQRSRDTADWADPSSTRPLPKDRGRCGSSQPHPSYVSNIVRPGLSMTPRHDA